MKNKTQILTVILSVVITLAVVFCGLWGMQLYRGNLPQGEHDETSHEIQDVTMIQLIATPEKYHRKPVRVIGVGNLEFEGNCISLSQEDFKYSVGNSIWIELDAQALSYETLRQYNGQYVIIEGIFDQEDCGHMDLFRGSIKNVRRYDLWDAYLSTHVTVTQEADRTYSYQIIDDRGQLLDAKKQLIREPQRHRVSPHIIGLCTQSGTGRSTNYAQYYDLENSRISETFYYVLDGKDGYVVRVAYRDGVHIIIVQDIFDQAHYYQEYPLENVSPVAADAVVDGYFNADGTITVTYLSGEDYTETNRTIPMPPKDTGE